MKIFCWANVLYSDLSEWSIGLANDWVQVQDILVNVLGLSYGLKKIKDYKNDVINNPRL